MICLCYSANSFNRLKTISEAMTTEASSSSLSEYHHFKLSTYFVSCLFSPQKVNLCFRKLLLFLSLLFIIIINLFVANQTSNSYPGSFTTICTLILVIKTTFREQMTNPMTHRSDWYANNQQFLKWKLVTSQSELKVSSEWKLKHL